MTKRPESCPRCLGHVQPVIGGLRCYGACRKAWDGEECQCVPADPQVMAVARANDQDLLCSFCGKLSRLVRISVGVGVKVHDGEVYRLERPVVRGPVVDASMSLARLQGELEARKLSLRDVRFVPDAENPPVDARVWATFAGPDTSVTLPGANLDDVVAKGLDLIDRIRKLRSDDARDGA